MFKVCLALVCCAVILLAGLAVYDFLSPEKSAYAITIRDVSPILKHAPRFTREKLQELYDFVDAALFDYAATHDLNLEDIPSAADYINLLIEKAMYPGLHELPDVASAKCVEDFDRSIVDGYLFAVELTAGERSLATQGQYEEYKILIYQGIQNQYVAIDNHVNYMRCPTLIATSAPDNYIATYDECLDVSEQAIEDFDRNVLPLFFEVFTDLKAYPRFVSSRSGSGYNWLSTWIDADGNAYRTSVEPTFCIKITCNDVLIYYARLYDNGWYLFGGD